MMDVFSPISEKIMTVEALSSTGLLTVSVVLSHSLPLSLSPTLGFRRLNPRCRMLEVFQADAACRGLIGWNNVLAH